MRKLICLAFVALSCGDGGDGVVEPESPATQRVTLHFVGMATSGGQPVEGAVIEYRVAPCPFFEECSWRARADTTDGQGRYSITAERTCVINQSLLAALDSVRSDRLSAHLPLGPHEICGSAEFYGSSELLCTSAAQEKDFDFTGCPTVPADGL